MRIIRTAIRRDRRKAALIAAFISVLPAAAFFSIKAAPLISELVTASVSGLRVSGLISGSISDSLVNNGSQLLYVPEEEASPADEEPAVPESDEVPDTSRFLTTENLTDASEDLTAFSAHSGAIREETYTHVNGDAFIDLEKGGQLRNCTGLPNDYVREETAKPSSLKIELYSDEPQVLILHTHTSESYEPCEKDWYDGSYTSRSSDPDNSVVAVGSAIAEELAASGINVVHDCTFHDEIYTGAYTRSLNTAVSVMTRYPSVKVVLDVHRDAIESADGTRVSAVADIDGKKAAQVMIISAADDGTYGIPRYIENMHFACELQQAMESRYAGLTRPVLFQYCQYNQQVSTGALLLEVGSHGNTVEQAVYSGHLIGKSLAELLCEKAEELAVPCSMTRSIPLYFVDRLR